MSMQWERGDLFELTADHLVLLKSAYVGWQDCETGAPEINPKRPYGNSDVATDIIGILGWDWPPEEEEEKCDSLRARALSIHHETHTALQIVLGCQTLVPGLYRYIAGPYDRPEWRRV